jgi:hypothetical protein
MLFVLSRGAGSLEGSLSPEVEVVALGIAGEEDDAKWIVKEAGPSWSSLRETVMGMAGLWYFSRGR